MLKEISDKPLRKLVNDVLAPLVEKIVEECLVAAAAEPSVGDGVPWEEGELKKPKKR